MLYLFPVGDELDGFATEHQTGLSIHFIPHKPSDVLFKLTVIMQSIIVPFGSDLDGFATERQLGILYRFAPLMPLMNSSSSP